MTTPGDAETSTQYEEAALEATRERVASDVEELVHRFSPEVVKERIEERLLARLEPVFGFVRRRPALVASVGAAGVILAVWGWSRRRAHAGSR